VGFIFGGPKVLDENGNLVLNKDLNYNPHA